jgi:type 1 glutamine amidotransferase
MILPATRISGYKEHIMDKGFNPMKTLRKTNAAVISAAAGVSAAEAAETFAKRPGETKVVAMMAHDVNHNGVAQEVLVRSILEPEKDWRIIFVRSSRLFTPALIADADLLITARTGIPDPIDLTTDAVTDKVIPGAVLWTEENVHAIIENVRDRGMGFLALHNTLYCRNRDITELMGIEPIMHRAIQPLWVYDINQDHPITKGIGKFWIGLDEQFGAIIKSEYTTSLFSTQAMHDKRTAVGGWCLENGKGRVACLLPGHTVDPYRHPSYRDIVWRAAHWVVRQEVKAIPEAKGGN